MGPGRRRRSLRPWIAVAVVVVGVAGAVAIVRAREGSRAEARTAPPTTARAVAAAPARPRPSLRERALERFAARPAAVVRGGARGHLVALTFDDGPGPYTLRIVRELRRLHAPATFFVVGRQVHWYPLTMHDMVVNGDAIGVHTWDHADLRRLPSRADRVEIRRTAAVIRAYAGVRTRLLRPPFGSLDRRVLRLARRSALVTVLWSVDTADWARPGERRILQRALAAVRPGAIVLLHDGGGDRDQTVAAVPLLVRALRARGYRLVTVTRLLALAPPPPGTLNLGQSLRGD
jgi:peptidoglycan/xylan/chitin deacetylase (PgdA/CDA1 family)